MLPIPWRLLTNGEDGIHICRDGVGLYCVYVSEALLSFNHGGLNPIISGVADLSTIFISSSRHEKSKNNPNLEILDASNMVLSFDSDNYTGNVGNHDICNKTSSEAGMIRTEPANAWRNGAGESTIPVQQRKRLESPLLRSASRGQIRDILAKTDDGERSGCAGKRRKSSTARLNTGVICEPALAARRDLSFTATYDNGKEGPPSGTTPIRGFLPEKQASSRAMRKFRRAINRAA